MPRWMLSQHWAHGPPVCPAVQTVTEVAGPYPAGLVKARSRTWVVDYEFASFGRTGIRRRKGFVWFPRPARTVHLYAPGVTYWEDPRGLTGRRHSAWIDFTGGEEAGLGALVGPDRYARFLDPAGTVGALFREAAEAAHRLGEGGFWGAQGRLCDIVQHLVSALAVGEQTYRVGGRSAEASEASEFVRTVREFLRANLGRKTTLEQVARHVHVSISSLAHRYRREAGESVLAAAIRMRVEQARVLLRRGCSVKTVAHQLGFSDPHHLSKTFKRLAGASPREFLRRHKADEE